MDPDFSRLDDYLAAADVDGYLIDADGDDSDQYYLAGFHAPDPFVTLYDGGVHLLMARSLEYGRATREARADSVERDVDFGFGALREEYGPHEARDRVIARFLESHGVSSVAAPPRFPLATADGIREQGVDVSVDTDGVVTEIRATKTAEEIAQIRATQRANERAMKRAEELIAAAGVDTSGRLVLEGEPLTSERVREEIEVTLLRNGCSLAETIVAGGRDAADPHERGHGALQVDQPIIVDIFPRDKASRYHADMTRTFCRGEPDDRVREWHDLTLAAQAAALDAVEPGATGAAVHDAACEVYEEAGIDTLRTDESTDTGFIHSTGHGVGLDVHELPRLASGGAELEPGHVVTVEPGVYDPSVGGVRVEDLVVVTEDGHENLTHYDTALTLESA